MKIAPGYASLPARNRWERSIDRNQGLPKSPRLRRVIIACAPAHPAPSALRSSDGSFTHDRMLEGRGRRAGPGVDGEPRVEDSIVWSWKRRRDCVDACAGIVARDCLVGRTRAGSESGTRRSHGHAA
jgi:hypothetical protein